MNPVNLSFGLEKPRACKPDCGCIYCTITQSSMKKQLISIVIFSLSLLAIAPDAIAKEGCRNVNDDVHECVDKRQGPRRIKGYLAIKTLPPQVPETPRRIKIATVDRSTPPSRRGSPKGTGGGGTRFAVAIGDTTAYRAGGRLEGLA